MLICPKCHDQFRLQARLDKHISKCKGIKVGDLVIYHGGGEYTTRDLEGCIGVVVEGLTEGDTVRVRFIPYFSTPEAAANELYCDETGWGCMVYNLVRVEEVPHGVSEER